MMSESGNRSGHGGFRAFVGIGKREMTQPHWLGRLFAIGGIARAGLSRKTHSRKLGLGDLPGRDGPSSLTGFELNLVSAGALQGAITSLTVSPAETPAAPGPAKPGVSPAVDFFPTLEVLRADGSADTTSMTTISDPLPTDRVGAAIIPQDAVHETPLSSTSISVSITFGDVTVRPANPSESQAAGSVERNRGIAGNLVLPSGSTPIPSVVDPSKPSDAPKAVPPSSQAAAVDPVPQDPTSTIAFKDVTFQAYATKSRESVGNGLTASITSMVENPGDLSGTPTTIPGEITNTPPIFQTGQDAIDAESGPRSQSIESGIPPLGMIPGFLNGSTPVSERQSETGDAPSVLTTNTIVTPRSDAVGRPLNSDSELFRITVTPDSAAKQEVRYTLLAHDANGTISADGSVTITGGGNQAIVTAGPAFAGRSPEIMTILLREMPGVRPAKASTTLILTPPGERVGDSALFEAHRLGQSSEAFDTLVNRHSPAVMRASQRILGNRADAEDVTQFVFLTLAQWQLRFPGTLTGWLNTVARNASYALLRSKSRRLKHEREAARPLLSEPADSPNTLDEGLDSALGQLPAPLEQAVRLRYLDGWSQQEAAQIVGCPRGTLSRRAATGIEALRELLAVDSAAAG